MNVTEQPVKFISRGKAFDTKEEAERHDSLISAREALETAQRKFQRLLAEDCVTADGHQFELGAWGDYFRLVKPYDHRPFLQKMTYSYWSWAVREQREHPEVIEIRAEDRDDKPSLWVPIREIFQREGPANAALVAALREWLEEQVIQVGTEISKKGPSK